MNYTANIIITEDFNNIKKLFIAEEKKFPNGRACFEIKKEEDKLNIEIQASDATSLRAILNSITKNLSIYEKTKWTINNKKN